MKDFGNRVVDSFFSSTLHRLPLRKRTASCNSTLPKILSSRFFREDFLMKKPPGLRPAASEIRLYTSWVAGRRPAILHLSGFPPCQYRRRVVETMFTTTATPFVRLFHIGVQSKNQSKLHVVHGETFSTQTPFQTAHLQ